LNRAIATLFGISIFAAILLGAPLSQVYAEISDGDILVADPGANAIISVNPDSGAQTVISSGGDFAFAIDLAINANGELIVVDFDNVIKVNPDTGEQTIISTGGILEDPNGVAIDNDGNIIVTDLEVQEK